MDCREFRELLGDETDGRLAPADAQRYRATPEDRAALTDARIAALKAGLKLTAEQEKNWPAVETAIRDLAKQRADRASAMRDGRKSSRAAGCVAFGPASHARHSACSMPARSRSTSSLCSP